MLGRVPPHAELDSARNEMRALLGKGVSALDAIRKIREQYGFSLIQAKQIHVQAAGIAADLHDHQQTLADELADELARIDNAQQP
jgi:hypothetical protein